MYTEKVEIKSKGEVIGEFDYEYPESLEEGLQVDGEENVYKLYRQQRKIRFMDNKRREATGGGLPKTLVAALKTLPPEKLAALAEQLGLDLG
uniref:Uncharacterized protein n=1 Tax=viral metagenome TaxID=1070528 RepID=A0A6M3KA89_9ZZZZ